MQPSKQPLTTARRTLDIEDYIDIVRRYRTWILGPAFAGLVVGVVVAFLWPDTYVSYGVLKVDPQKVPEKYIQSNLDQDMTARVQAMRTEILSRPVLISIIQKFNLYPRERKNMPLEDVVEQMRNRDIEVGGISSQIRGNTKFPTFLVSFRYENRYLAQRVCNEFISKFMEENVRNRTDQAVATTGFLKDQFESAKKELEELEGKITQFRIQNQGRLPEQVQSNLQQMSALEARISVLQNTMSRANQDKILLEARLRSLKEQLASATAPPSVQSPKPAVKSEKLTQLEREIEQAELGLSGVRERYTASHPDVQRFEQQVAWLKKQKDALIKQEESARQAAIAAAAKNPAAAAARLSPAERKQLQELQGQIDQLELAIRGRTMEADQAGSEMRESEKQIKSLQARVEASPLNEPVYQQLMRDRDAVRERYTEMTRKKSMSETATLIEDRKQGENLSLLEPPILPQVPTYPNRYLIVGAGTVIGLMIGLALAGIREMKDTSLKNLKDVRAYTQLTVLGSIPLLENDFVVRRQRRIMVLAWSTAIFFGLLIMSGSVYYYYTITRV